MLHVVLLATFQVQHLLDQQTCQDAHALELERLPIVIMLAVCVEVEFSRNFLVEIAVVYAK